MMVPYAEHARLQVSLADAQRAGIAVRRALLLVLGAVEAAMDRQQAVFTAADFAALEQAKRVLAGEVDS